MAVAISPAFHQHLVDLLLSPGGAPNGSMSMFEGSSFLAGAQLPNPWGSEDLNGNVAANSTINLTAQASGTIDNGAILFRLDNTEPFAITFSVSEPGGGGDIIVPETTVATNDTIPVEGFVVTLPTED